MSEANEVPINNHIMGHLDDIQTALKPLKIRKNWKKIMIILGLAE